MWCVCLIGLIVSLIIGLPCSIKGCNDFSCPLRYRFDAHVIACDPHQEICSKCMEYDEDGACARTRDYECTKYITSLTYPNGTCGIKTDNSFALNQTLIIRVDKFGSPDCSFPTQLSENAVWVGIVFNIIAVIFVILMVYFIRTES